MKPKRHFHNLAGIGTLFIACSGLGAAQITHLPTYPDVSEAAGVAALNNGTQDAAMAVARTIGRIPQYRWGVFEAPPVEVPATDSKGAVVKRVDSKGAMAPSVANERWEVFATAYWLGQKVDQQWPPRLVPESDVDMWGVNAGARYRINDEWSVGGMIGYNNANVDLKVNSFTLAKVQVDTWSITPFVTYEKKNLVAGADFLATLQYTYGDSSYDNTLLIIAPGLKGSRDGYSNSVELNTGLVWTSGNLHHGPILGLRYTDIEVDAFRFGATPIASASYDSFASTLGYQLSYDIKLGSGKIVPALSVAWEHEFEDSYNSVVAGVPNASLGQDTAVIGAGVGWYGNCGWSTVISYEARFNDEAQSNFVGLKVGKSF